MKILWDDKEIRLTVVAMMDNSIQIPLDLPDVRVLEVGKTKEGNWLIRAIEYSSRHKMP